MNQRTIFRIPRLAPEGQSEVIRFPDQEELDRVFEVVFGQGDCLPLGSRQRVPIPPANKVIVLPEGIF
jgi:hypothetical protein